MSEERPPWEPRPAERTRPQLASLTREDGSVLPLMVDATDDPNLFVLRTLQGGPVRMRPGDRVWIDVIGPGQSVTIDRLEEGP